MNFDVTGFADNLSAAASLGAAVEDYGFDGLWLAETAHNPFLSLAQATLATRRISLGTAVAIAFPRSPLLLAKTAWGLAELSQGRFILGLGTQVKPHITKRFSAPWTKPRSQLREYILALRAIWAGFQSGNALHFQGEYYQFSPLVPGDAPPPMPHAQIPIYIAGVNTGLAELAGELCEGFHVHSFHTPRYLREVLLPAFRKGREQSSLPAPLKLACAVFVVTGQNAAEVAASKQMAKSQIAFYASTPSYRRVLELHGWQELVPQLNALLRRKRWDSLHELISDEMLEEFALIAPPDELPYRLWERYGDLLDHAGFYYPFNPSDQSQRIIWREAAKAMGAR